MASWRTGRRMIKQKREISSYHRDKKLSNPPACGFFGHAPFVRNGKIHEFLRPFLHGDHCTTVAGFCRDGGLEPD
jgi:hypothetical protein